MLKNFFAEDISYAQVSNLEEKFNELRTAWENSPLESCYKIVYCDAIYITVKRGDNYAHEPVHITYGVREDNKRELLDLSINPSESSNSWAETFIKLKQRGIAKIDLIVADGLNYLENEVHKYFPGTSFQKCVVHKMRNVLNKVRPKDKALVAEDLKQVFNNFDNDSTLTKAMEKLEDFKLKWKQAYPDIARAFAETNIEYYFTYIKFHCSVRRMIYTTNSIEGLNKKIRKATKNKQSFEKPERLLDYLFVIIKEFELENWMKFPVSTFRVWIKQTQSS